MNVLLISAEFNVYFFNRALAHSFSIGTIINNNEDNRGKYLTSEYLWNEYTISSRLTVKNFTAQDVGRSGRSSHT